MHNGQIGGGQKGFGKKLFFEKYKGELITANYGNKEKKVALIGNLNDPNFYNDIKNFVSQIIIMKNSQTTNVPDAESHDELGGF